MNTRTPSPASPSPVAEGQAAAVGDERTALLYYIDERANSVIGRADIKAIFAEIGAAIRSDMARIAELEAALSSQAPKPASAGGERATDDDLRAWAERHDIRGGVPLNELRCMFEDAQSWKP